MRNETRPQRACALKPVAFAQIKNSFQQPALALMRMTPPRTVITSRRQLSLSDCTSESLIVIDWGPSWSALLSPTELWVPLPGASGQTSTLWEDIDLLLTLDLICSGQQEWEKEKRRPPRGGDPTEEVSHGATEPWIRATFFQFTYSERRMWLDLVA